jgi:hypothetical protein
LRSEGPVTRAFLAVLDNGPPTNAHERF